MKSVKTNLKNRCSVRRCGRESARRSLCHTHYDRWRKLGEVVSDIPIREKLNGMSPLQRFLRSVKKKKGCWGWRGATTKFGYGQLTNGGKHEMAHRLSYKLFVGALAKGMTIDHLCGNTSCVNPKHLEQVTQRENTLRGNAVTAKNARKTRCQNGHEFNSSNTRMSVDGKRICKICRRSWDRLYQRKKRRQIKMAMARRGM